ASAPARRLNRLRARLGASVIAIRTEFAVLLPERFRAERAGGLDLPAALAGAYRSTGRAVAASGVTAIAGFGVLAFSDIRMLRDFGLVTLIDLSVSLLGVLLALPAALVRFGAGLEERPGAQPGAAYAPAAARPGGGEPVHEHV